jgi:nucleolar protein 15
MAPTSKSSRSAHKKQPAPVPLPSVPKVQKKIVNVKPPSVPGSDAGSGSADEEEWGGVAKKLDDEGEEQEASEEQDDDYLHGFSSDDDSSDEEDVEVEGIDVTKLPTIAKDDKTVQSKLSKAKKEPVSITRRCNI